ncbi:MAG TPA: hypothetical protein PKJ12_01690 [Ottowia sp.]|nr:hypothetical protein [Ottowia sp.]HNK51991.1 hypothetical protein [Ottowia sp.]HNL40808.1 hypothetical protein [Ottowia sp.]HNN32630.1 hypothetical protein [Ottowia sp.]HNO41279.1 hypothetical protein [Ottowia sp.]
MSTTTCGICRTGARGVLSGMAGRGCCAMIHKNLHEIMKSINFGTWVASDMRGITRGERGKPTKAQRQTEGFPLDLGQSFLAGTVLAEL